MLQDLVTPRAAADWLATRVSGRLRTDSRSVRAGDGFVAWPGYGVDGRQFVAAALAAGATACLVEHEGAAGYAFADGQIAALGGLKSAAGALADAFYQSPSQRIAVIASTGTNGKTSTTWWMAQALSALGKRCGVIGTLGVGEPGHVEPTGLTTPDPITLHASLRSMADQGFAACAIEASSIGIVEHRLNAVHIAVALFTNFTQDHLDYHGSMAEYWAAKRALFAWPGLRAAVINIDDARGHALATELQGGPLKVWTVSLQHAARLQAQGLSHADGGLAFEVVEALERPQGRAAPSPPPVGVKETWDGPAFPCERVSLRSRLVGEFNASNLMVVIGGLRALGVPLQDAVAAVCALTPVPGRMQRVAGQDVDVVVDYAHTPDALDKALQALRPLAAARGGRLWCVFGCGGNRDAVKRPLMGAIAARGADQVLITSDNPRDESPAAILGQILAGATLHAGVQVIEDRAQAIATAVLQAGAGDVILLAGKGHEDYQEVAGVKRPFSDLQQALAALRERDAAAGAQP